MPNQVGRDGGVRLLLGRDVPRRGMLPEERQRLLLAGDDGGNVGGGAAGEAGEGVVRSADRGADGRGESREGMHEIFVVVSKGRGQGQSVRRLICPCAAIFWQLVLF
jgi:hypothetical protein